MGTSAAFIGQRAPPALTICRALRGCRGLQAKQRRITRRTTTHTKSSIVSPTGTCTSSIWAGVAPVAGWALTAQSGAPVAASDPDACYSVGINTKQVYFRSADGGLHEILLVPGTTPARGNLTAAYGAPPAADRSTAFTVEGPNTQHVAFRTTANHNDESIW